MVRFIVGVVCGMISFSDIHDESVFYYLVINLLPDSIVVAAIFIRLGLVQR